MSGKLTVIVTVQSRYCYCGISDIFSNLYMQNDKVFMEIFDLIEFNLSLKSKIIMFNVKRFENLRFYLLIVKKLPNIRLITQKYNFVLLHSRLLF